MTAIRFEERKIPSSDGVHQLYCRIFFPQETPVGLFHVVHGMIEHIRRYEDFMRALAAQGWLCYGFDNLGHGYTVSDMSELGYPGKWQYLADDVRSVTRKMKAEFGKELPCVLMGHSMGSFIVRLAATPALWDKLIVMGTAGPNPVSEVGLALIAHKIKKEGDRAVSPMMEKMIFGSYNKRFLEEKDRISWLSTVPAVRDAYRSDPYCNYHFTLNGFETLIKLQTLCNSAKWFSRVSPDLPILLLSGADDPVGSYGAGVRKVYEELLKNGKKVEMKLYEGARHEILHEPCSQEVIEDISTAVAAIRA